MPWYGSRPGVRRPPGLQQIAPHFKANNTRGIRAMLGYSPSAVLMAVASPILEKGF